MTNNDVLFVMPFFRYEAGKQSKEYMREKGFFVIPAIRHRLRVI